MRKILLTVVSVTTVFGVWAQAGKPASAAASWKRGGIVSLTLSQGGTRNWAPGGDRFTLAANGFLHLYANHTKKRCHWDNSIDVNYGLLNSRTQGIIKNDDKLDFISRWSHELGKGEVHRFRYGALLNFRTQMQDGYDYDGDEVKRISAFLAPAVTTLSTGIEYFTKDGSLNVHLGPAARWVLVANRPYELAAGYGVNPDQKVRIEAGLFSSIGYDKEIMKNVTWTSRLDLFSDFINDAPANVDIFFTNMFYMRVNKYFGVVYNFDLQYDDNTRLFEYTKDRPGTQLKSILGVGLSMKF
jgi:hypothetical protein